VQHPVNGQANAAARGQEARHASLSQTANINAPRAIPRRNRSSKEPRACRQCKHGRSNAWVDARERPSETVRSHDPSIWLSWKESVVLWELELCWWFELTMLASVALEWLLLLSGVPQAAGSERQAGGRLGRLRQ
jgi:hypothetical protein